MSKRNQLIGIEKPADDVLLLHTRHFSVTMTFKDVMFRDVQRRTSQRIDSFLDFDYNVISRTTYATKYQIKKFLRKFIIGAIKDAINRHKEEQNNG